MTVAASQTKTAYSSEAAQCDVMYHGAATGTIEFITGSEVCMMLLALLAYLVFFLDVTKLNGPARGKKDIHKKLAALEEDAMAEDADLTDSGDAIETENTQASPLTELSLSSETIGNAKLTGAETDGKTGDGEDDEDEELATAAPSVATSTCSWDSLDLFGESSSSSSSSSQLSPVALPMHRMETFRVSLAGIAEQLGNGDLGLEEAVEMIRLESCLLPEGAGYAPYRTLTRQVLSEAPASERRLRLAPLLPAIIDAGLVTYPCHVA